MNKIIEIVVIRIKREQIGGSQKNCGPEGQTVRTPK